MQPDNKEQSLNIALTESEAIVECYNIMHYDAIGLTTHDLQLGASFLTQLEKKASFPFLSATILNKKTKKPLFTPHTIISRATLKIGIIGLTAQQKTKETATYTIIDWQQPLQQSLKQLGNVDLIILLSNLSHQDNHKISTTYPDVHIILEAGQTLNNPQIQLSSNTVVSHTPKDGKYIGGLKIDWYNSKTWKTDDRQTKQLKNEIDRLLWFKNRITKRGGPEKAYQNNPSALQSYNAKMNQLQGLQKKLHTLQENDNKTQQLATYQSLLKPLKPVIPDEPQTTKILKSSRKKTNKLRRKTDVHKRFDVYTGSASCKPCHTSIYTEYKKTRHSRAYGTLERNSANHNPNCIFCHVTGLPERLAYIQAKIPDRLLEVGCETCHGAGQQHIKQPKSYKLRKDVPETTCLTCHTEDHTDDFQYIRDVELVH